MLSGFKKTFALILAVVLLLAASAMLSGCQPSLSQPGVTTTVPTTAPTTVLTTAPTTVPDTTAEQTTAPATTAAPETDPPAAYVYPVLPGTDEWNAMESHADMLAVCQIPEDVLKSLTTRELLIAVLDYPLMVDMHCYSTMEQGFLSVKNQFNGLEELVSRPDAKEVADGFKLEGTRWEENSLIEASLQAIIKYGLTTYAEGPYTYPVTTGTEAELLEACQVSQDILLRLSDDDLVLTVVNHPLINKVLAEGFDQAAYEALCQSINCLGELDLRGPSMGMKIFVHIGDPTGVEEYALEYYSEVLTALFTFIQN